MSDISVIQQSFLLFCKNMEPNHVFAEHHKFICKKAQVLSDTPNGRLLLSIPPGHGKSSLLSVLYAAWLLGKNPKERILIVTYGQSLSSSFGKRVRKYLNSEVYKKIFPNTLIKGEGDSGSFDTTAGGYLNAVGRGGSMTGRRYDTIICDDVLKNQQEAQSDTIINNLHSWFGSTCLSRLVPPGKFIGIATRWSKRDLIGHILDNYEGWPYINIPALCEDEAVDPLGRKLGEPLWPAFYPLKMLNEIRRASPKTFNALYQGNCVAEEATPIKAASLETSIIKEYDKSTGKIIASWDTASTEGSGDYTICTIWKVYQESAVLLEIVRAQVDFNGLIDLFDKVDSHWKTHLHIIENASSGQQLIQINNKKYNILMSQTIKATLKETLAESFNVALKRGIISILEGSLNSADKEEITDYPYGKHDDLPMSILHFYKNYLNNLDLLINARRLNNTNLSSTLKRYASATKYMKKKKDDLESWDIA